MSRTAVPLHLGAAIHDSSALAAMAIAATSKRSSGAGSFVPPARFSQLYVKLGVILPPTNMMSPTIAAMPSRRPYSGAPRTNTST